MFLGELFLQPGGCREGFVPLDEHGCHPVVAVEGGTGAPVGQRKSPFVEQLLTDRERVESPPAVDPHQPLALRTGQRGFGERCRHTADRRRVSVAVAQREAQGGERRALFEGADHVLELERLPSGGVFFLQPQPFDRSRRRELDIGVTEDAVGVGVELLDVATVHVQVAPVEILQPDDRGALVERLLQQRAYLVGVARVGSRGDREHSGAPALPVDHGDEVRLEPVEGHRNRSASPPVISSSSGGKAASEPSLTSNRSTKALVARSTDPDSPSTATAAGTPSQTATSLIRGPGRRYPQWTDRLP